MIRKILVPVRGDGKGDNVLAHAAALAKRYGCHITVAHCHARGEDFLPYGVPIPSFLKEQFMKQAEIAANQEEERIRGELSALAGTIGLRTVEKPDGNGATVSWVEEEGRQVDVIKHHGRLADLIAVAKPDVVNNIGTNSLKAALFNTGTPVMMCPPTETPPADLGCKITIAWNGSMEAARAVALTMPIIGGADDVVILTSGDESEGASSEDLVDYLKQRGIDSEIELFTAKKKIGQELLERSMALGADLMIMGAYGDSYERETVFGGNTQYIVNYTQMPIILVH